MKYGVQGCAVFYVLRGLLIMRLFELLCFQQIQRIGLFENKVTVQYIIKATQCITPVLCVYVVKGGGCSLFVCGD